MLVKSLGTMLNSESKEINGTLRKKDGVRRRCEVNLIYEAPMGTGYISMPCFSISHAQMLNMRTALL